MSWAVFKNGRQVGKFYDTKIQAITEAKEKKLVIAHKGSTYLAEGVEVREIKKKVKEDKIEQVKLIKEYRFTVRERLKRNRIYIIKAKDEEEARDLLNGFKQIPKEEDATQEDIVVDDYDVEYVDRNDPQVDEKVQFTNGNVGVIVGVTRERLSVKLSEDRVRSIEPYRLDWSEELNMWVEIPVTKG